MNPEKEEARKNGSQPMEEDEGDEEVEEYKDAPSTVVTIKVRNKRTEEDVHATVLLDTGTKGNMITKAAAIKMGLRITPAPSRKYRTAAGPFETNQEAKIRTHHIIELNTRRRLMNLKVRVAPQELGSYDMILGRNYLSKYGIDLLFSESIISWDGLRTPMREAESDAHAAQQIQDNTYAESDLRLLSRKQTHLSLDQQNELYEVLQMHQELFKGQLGTWPNVEIELELKDGAEPYHCGKPIRIPHAHIETLKKELERLIRIGVLAEVNETTAGPWCAPSFIVPKKDQKVRFITDFRELNKRIKRRPWPMPHVLDLIQDIGQYTYVTAIDLSMGYYHFRLSEDASDKTTFILPWGLYKYLRMAMGLSTSPDFFQGHMYRLFSDKPYVKVYMDDILVFSHGNYSDHLKDVDEALKRLRTKNMAVNAEKTYWAVEEVDYLGFRLTKQGVLPQPKKIRAIQAMQRPRNKKEVRSFIGMVNYYRYMWKKRSHFITPLTDLTKKNVKFEWTEQHQKAFDTIKALVGKEVLLSFPDYSQ